MKKIIASILFVWVVVGYANAASYTITIPDNIVNDVIDGIAFQNGYKDNIQDPDDPINTIPNPESKTAFAKRMNRKWIRDNVRAWEANQSQKTAREQAITDADAKTETIDVR